MEGLILVALFATLLTFWRAGEARAEQLIADISQHIVHITTGFTGADVLLFGVSEEPGEVIVVVRGPETPTVVRRKDRVAGIWINQDRILFPKAPAFYHVAASHELSGEPVEGVLRKHGIGASLLRVSPAATHEDSPEIEEFRDALIRNKQRLGLYATQAWPITFVGQRLFRTTIRFPANVPTGSYAVDVFNVRDGRVTDMTTTPLVVSKAGFGAAVFDFAHNYSAIYGVVAVLVALMAGWAAGAMFRKV